MSGQLWLPASEDFILPGYLGRPLKGRWSAPKLRALFWPSGKICWQVNLYLINLRRSGLEVSTINTYASELSLYVRFLWIKNIELAECDDDILIDFADSLVHQKKSGSHINRVLHRVLRYYTWYQQVFPVEYLIGASGSGCQISITKQTMRTRTGRVAGKTSHISMVPPSVPRMVRPISLESVAKLVSACDDIGTTYFKRCRDRSIVTLLAEAGLRREELIWVQCDNVRDAAVNGGKIRVRTSKRRGNPEREIPLPFDTIAMLLEYINIARALRIKRLTSKLPGFIDGGWLFCTVSGKKMAAVTVSQIFSELRASAQTLGRATPHMLRHRYITLQVVARIRAMRKQNIGLEALTTILSRVASLSGHSSLQSLWTYVDWAFDELDSSLARHDTCTATALELVKALLENSRKEGRADLISELERVEHVLSQDPDASASGTVLIHSSLRKK